MYDGRNQNQKAVSRSLDPLIRCVVRCCCWAPLCINSVPRLSILLCITWSLRAARLIFVVTFTLFDVSYAVYNHYSGIKTNTG